MLKVESISKRWDDFFIQSLNFTVNEGDYFVLLGESGAGKTVILEIIAGMLTPDSGSIFLNNKDLTNEKIQKRNIGMVFQDYSIFPHKSVFENIAYPLKIRKIRKQKIREQVELIAEELNIANLLHRMPDTLSGGEQQRTVLARALITKPTLLLLDEPLAALDIQLKADARKLLRSINKKGQTILHVTHDYEEALSLANQVAVMQNGKITQNGNVKDVFANPKSGFIASFIGIRNFYEATIRDANKRGSKLAMITNTIGFRLTTESADEEGFILIRQEDILLSKERFLGSTRNNFSGKIVEIEPARNGIEVTVDIGVPVISLLTNESFEKMDIKVNDIVWICFKASAVRFLV